MSLHEDVGGEKNLEKLGVCTRTVAINHPSVGAD